MLDIIDYYMSHIVGYYTGPNKDYYANCVYGSGYYKRYAVRYESSHITEDNTRNILGYNTGHHMGYLGPI
jgi:hypothetical protein